MKVKIEIEFADADYNVEHAEKAYEALQVAARAVRNGVQWQALRDYVTGVQVGAMTVEGVRQSWTGEVNP